MAFFSFIAFFPQIFKAFWVTKIFWNASQLLRVDIRRSESFHRLYFAGRF